MLHVRDTFETLCHKIDLHDPLVSAKVLGVDYDKMSMEDFVHHHGGKETALRTVTVWTKAMLGLEPREVSALFFLAYCKSSGGIMQMRSDERDGGQFLRLAEGKKQLPFQFLLHICSASSYLGTQSFSKKMTALVPQGTVHLNSPVISIDDNGSIVTVATSRRTFRAKRVILSIPSVLYKTIMFQPPLPAAKDKLVNNTVHGHLSKVFLAYRTPWWREHGCCGLTQSLTGLVAVTRDTSNDKAGHYSLLGFIAGDAGRTWSKLPAQQRRQAVIDHFCSVFDGVAEEIPEPVDYIEQMWWNEPFSQGCPCPAMPPGLMTQVGGDVTGLLMERHGNVHFVGTEMADVWRGYMDGAVRSGEKGANEVLGFLKNTTYSKL
jgi:monoamine oxidase